jgi:hypothetical protein
VATCACLWRIIMHSRPPLLLRRIRRRCIHFRRIPRPFVSFSFSLCLSWGNLAELERQQRRLGISLSLIANVAAAGLPHSRTAWQSGRFSKLKTREDLYITIEKSKRKKKKEGKDFASCLLIEKQEREAYAARL